MTSLSSVAAKVWPVWLALEPSASVAHGERRSGGNNDGLRWSGCSAEPGLAAEAALHCYRRMARRDCSRERGSRWNAGGVSLDVEDSLCLQAGRARSTQIARTVSAVQDVARRIAGALIVSRRRVVRLKEVYEPIHS